ncbi:hypothetical protein TKK_0007513 [Trichogramma kaykai]
MAEDGQDCLKKMRELREEPVVGTANYLTSVESCVYYTGGEAGSNADIPDDRWEEIVEFVAGTGYKDEPKVVEGRPPLLRTTAIHRAGKLCHYAVRELFEIYDRYDLNYSDETGGTHFHVACLDDQCVNVVKKFLEHGQDPDCRPREEWQKDSAAVVVESPLHSALNRCNFLVTEAAPIRI